MQYKLRLWWRCLLVVGIVGVVLVSIYRIPSAAGFVASSQQDVIRLETRLTQLEQRIYSIETNLRILEQQSRISGGSRNVSQEDINLLRAEIQTLRNRLVEDECGLAKLDERTLTPAKRGRVGAGDPCRLNFDIPLRLSATN